MNPLFAKIFLSFFLLLCSYCGYTQNNTIDSLKRVLQTQKEDTSRVNTLNALSREMFINSDDENSLKKANEALTSSEKLNYKKGIAEANRRIGRINHIQNNIPEASKHYFIALKLFQEIGDKLEMGDCNSLIGQIKENHSEALINLITALKLYEEIGDKSKIALTLQLIGAAHFYNGNYIEAKKNYLASIEISKEINDKQLIAQTTVSLGGLYSNEGNDTKALDHFFAALKIYETLGNNGPDWGIPWTYNMISGIYLSQGEAAEKSGDKITAQKKYLEVEKLYSKVLNIHKTKKNISFYAETYRNIGYLNIRLKNYNKAKENFDKSLKFATSLNDKIELKNTYKAFQYLDVLQGNYKQAYEHYNKYILYSDSLKNDESTKKAVQVQMNYEFEKKELTAKAVQDKKDANAKRTRNLQYYALGAFLLLAVFLYWNISQKQKAKTKIEKAYTDIKSTQSQLIQSEKMASLGELTAGIAHEIQNPLNFVNNFSDVSTELVDEMNSEIEKGNTEDAKLIAQDLKQNLEKINHHGKRAGDIVKNMLQHSRSSSGVKEPTDINKLSDEYLRLAYHGLRAKDKSFNATMKTDYDETIESINIIPQDIGRVILNLITNAFYVVNEKKKSPHPLKGDEEYEPIVTVATRRVKSPSGDLGAEIKVSDNGNGIPQKILDKIFQPFFTTKPTGQGTGLGLSLSYDIVKAHGGDLKVETREGKGTEFVISLPL